MFQLYHSLSEVEVKCVVCKVGNVVGNVVLRLGESVCM